MGICFGSTSKFKINDKRGQDKVASKFFEKIGIEKYDVSVFYSLFLELDLRDHGTIPTDDLYVKYRYSMIIVLEWNR